MDLSARVGFPLGPGRTERAEKWLRLEFDAVNSLIPLAISRETRVFRVTTSERKSRTKVISAQIKSEDRRPNGKEIRAKNLKASNAGIGEESKKCLLTLKIFHFGNFSFRVRSLSRRHLIRRGPYIQRLMSERNGSERPSP